MRVLGTVFVLILSSGCLSVQVPFIRSNHDPNRQEDTSGAGASADPDDLSYNVSAVTEGPRRHENQLSPLTPSSSPSGKEVHRSSEYQSSDELFVADSAVRKRSGRHEEQIYPLGSNDAPSSNKYKSSHENSSKIHEVRIRRQGTSTEVDCKEDVILLNGTNFTTATGKTLENIMGMTVINNPYLTELNFAGVGHLFNRITIANNSKLTDANFTNSSAQSLEFVLVNNSMNADTLNLHLDFSPSAKSIQITGNENLVEMQLPSLVWIDNELLIENNKDLVKVELPILADINGLRVIENAALEILNISKVISLTRDKPFVVERNAKLKELIFSSVRTVRSTVFRISDNAKLEKIILAERSPVNYKAKSMTISRNPNLSKIAVAKFNESIYAKQIEIYGNRNLLRSEIDFPDLSKCIGCYIQEDNECIFDEPVTNLSELDDCKNIYGNLTINSSVTGNTKAKIQAIQQNLNITNMTFGGDDLKFLENAMVKGEFRMNVTENSDLEFFKIHDVAIIRDNLIVERNRRLKELLIRKIGKFTSPAISVDRNPKLTKIVIGKFKDTKNASNIKIYGNRNLLRAGIHFADDAYCIDCYIQEDNECIFDEPITDLSELDGCKNIYGSLTINSDATGNTSTNIYTIQEDLIITNTALTIEDFHFLVNTTVNGKFEFTGPCSSKLLYLKLKLTVESDKKSFNPKYCLVNCTGEELVTYKQPHCEIVTGNIIMEYCSYTAEDVKNFKSIKKVIGGIGMNYVGPKNFSLAPLMFDNLEEIETPKGGSSIEFWNLKYTNEFIAPKLVRVINPDVHFIELNGNNFSNADGKEFETCLRMEARLAGREFDPEDLQIGGYVTRIIRVNESELHYDDGASNCSYISLLLVFLWNI